MVIEANRRRDLPPVHPGALLADLLEDVPARKSDIARGLQISRNQLYAIMRGDKPVSASVAVKLGKMFGNGAGLWTRMQATYDTWHAEREVDVSDVPFLEKF